MLVFSDIIRFLFWSGHITGVPCRFLLDLQPRVHVGGEESRFSLLGWTVPDFMDTLYLLTLFYSFDEFWGTPGSSWRALFESVRTTMRLLQEQFGHFLFHTTHVEWKSDFTLMPLRKDWMI